METKLIGLDGFHKKVLILSEKLNIVNLLIESKSYWWAANWKISQPDNSYLLACEIKDFDMIYNKFDVSTEVRILEKRNDWIGNPKTKWFDRDFIIDNTQILC